MLQRGGGLMWISLLGVAADFSDGSRGAYECVVQLLVYRLLFVAD